LLAVLAVKKFNDELFVEGFWPSINFHFLRVFYPKKLVFSCSEMPNTNFKLFCEGHKEYQNESLAYEKSQ
jgi:hypothetical protein